MNEEIYKEMQKKVDADEEYAKFWIDTIGKRIGIKHLQYKYPKRLSYHEYKKFSERS